MMKVNKFHEYLGKKSASVTDYTLVKHQICIYFHEFRMPS